MSDDVLALVLGGDLAASGVNRFRDTAPFDAVLPSGVPDGVKPTVTRAIGLLELIAAGMLVARRTRPAGAWLSILALVGVAPSNLAAARLGGYPGLSGIPGSPAVSWLRVGLQPVAIAMVCGLTRPPAGG